MRREVEPQMRRVLIAYALAYAEATGRKLSTVSWNAHGDSPFFDNLIAQEKKARTGKRGSFTARKFDEVMAWFDENWPPDTAKPQVCEPFENQANHAPVAAVRMARRRRA